MRSLIKAWDAPLPFWAVLLILFAIIMVIATINAKWGTLYLFWPPLTFSSFCYGAIGAMCTVGVFAYYIEYHPEKLKFVK